MFLHFTKLLAYPLNIPSSYTPSKTPKKKKERKLALVDSDKSYAALYPHF